MRGWLMIIVLILVGYIIGSKWPGMFRKVTAMAG